MFEPGKTAAMGLPRANAQKPAAICTQKDSPCMPNLAVNHQKCLGHRTKSVLDKGYKIPDEISQACKLIKTNMEDCHKCHILEFCCLRIKCTRVCRSKRGCLLVLCLCLSSCFLCSCCLFRFQCCPTLCCRN